jgi:glycine/D-amino acid oxidase-like deaminating enzyme
MDLYSRYPFWLIKNGLLHTYPSLATDRSVDVAVIGAGITGAILSWYFYQAGLDFMVVDKGNVGMGSTSASTALIQYEIDHPLRELQERYGKIKALRSYRLCLEAVDEICSIASAIGHPSVKKRESFQFASVRKDYGPLMEEYSLRSAHGFPVRWLEKKEIREKFHFNATGGIFSASAAEMDPYLFTHDLFHFLHGKGLEIYDGTPVTRLEFHKRHVLLHAGNGYKIKANHVVIACGYESQDHLPKAIESLQTTYAIISEPGPDSHPWFHQALIWETARPYRYLRTTPDNRIIIGGKDSPFSSAAKRNEALASKARALERSFHHLMPELPFKSDFAWSGIFGTTKDGLPYIGSTRINPRLHFALGFGGNGITFSAIAGMLLADLLKGKGVPDLELFSFQR